MAQERARDGVLEGRRRRAPGPPKPRGADLGESKLDDAKVQALAPGSVGCKRGRRLRRQAAKAIKKDAEEREAAGDGGTPSSGDASSWSEWVQHKINAVSATIQAHVTSSPTVGA